MNFLKFIAATYLSSVLISAIFLYFLGVDHILFLSTLLPVSYGLPWFLGGSVGGYLYTRLDK